MLSGDVGTVRRTVEVEQRVQKEVSFNYILFIYVFSKKRRRSKLLE